MLFRRVKIVWTHAKRAIGPRQLARLNISSLPTDHKDPKKGLVAQSQADFPGMRSFNTQLVPWGLKMIRFQLHWFLRTCLLATVSIVALVLSFALLPSVEAKPVCLRIALPESAAGPVGPEAYRAVMRDAGLCVDPVPMPNARAFMALRHNQVDGVFAMLEDFKQSVKTPVIRGNTLVGNPDGILVVKDDGPRGVSELTSEEIGIWLGASWSEKMLGTYDHVVRVPGGPAMMREMLVKGRLDGMLLNSFSLKVVGGAPEGFVQIPVTKLEVYSWLRAEHASQMEKFDVGTALYLEKIIAWHNRAS